MAKISRTDDHRNARGRSGPGACPPRCPFQKIRNSSNRRHPIHTVKPIPVASALALIAVCW